MYFHDSISMYINYKLKCAEHQYFSLFLPLFSLQGGVLGFFQHLTAACHSFCSKWVSVTGSWLAVIPEKVEDVFCPLQKTAPILVKGERRYEGFLKSSFTVVYDRDANGLNVTVMLSRFFLI
jgi:hypothetical protein